MQLRIRSCGHGNPTRWLGRICGLLHRRRLGPIGLLAACAAVGFAGSSAFGQTCSCGPLIAPSQIVDCRMNEDGAGAGPAHSLSMTTQELRHANRFTGGIAATHVCVRIDGGLAGQAATIAFHAEDGQTGLPLNPPLSTQPFTIQGGYQLIPLTQAGPPGGDFWLAVHYSSIAHQQQHQYTADQTGGAAAVQFVATGPGWQTYASAQAPNRAPMLRLLEIGTAGQSCINATNSCYVESSAPGCADPDCCAAVCACDSYCCSNEWDDNCIGPNTRVPGCSALDLPECVGCGDGVRNCCVEDPINQPAPYCNDGDCCVQVCAQDPDCCEVEWDVNCALLAHSICSPMCDPTPCVTCPVGSVASCGPCGSGQCDACATAEIAQCGETYCGELSADLGVVDEHWYEIAMPSISGGFGALVLDLEFDMPVELEVSFGTCASPTTVAHTVVDPCAPQQMSFFMPVPTTAYVRIKPITPDSHPCSFATTYSIGFDIVDGNMNSACTTTPSCPTCLPGHLIENEPCPTAINDGCGMEVCAGFCGGQHPSGCWCDAACCAASDCCGDQMICPGACVQTLPAGVGTPLNCGDTMCGTVWEDPVDGRVDIDWYRIDVPPDPFGNPLTQIELTFESDVELEVRIQNEECLGHPNHAIWNGTIVPACATTNLSTPVPAPSVVYVVVKPTMSPPNGIPDACPDESSYTLELTCVSAACSMSTNDCCQASQTTPPSTGCIDSACCMLVCGQDAFCCQQEWDSLCAALAQSQCSHCQPSCASCPPGSIVSCDPCGTGQCGGCATGAFEPVQCGQTHCGELLADAGVIEEHWYELSIPFLTGPAGVLLEVEADMDVEIEIHMSGCAGHILNTFAIPACQLTSIIDIFPTPIDLDIVIRPIVATGHPCGGANDYSINFQVIDQATGNVCPSPCPPPPNDDCVNAMVVTEGTWTVDNQCATTDGPPEPCGFTGVNDADIWFEFVAECEQEYRVSVEDASGAGADRLLALYAGACPLGGPQIGCDAAPAGARAEILFRPTAVGQVFYIRVGSPPGQEGLSTLIIERTCPADLNNDGVVNVFDLLDLLAAWGQPCTCGPVSPPPSPCVINVFAMLNLLAAWGPCP